MSAISGISNDLIVVDERLANIAGEIVFKLNLLSKDFQKLDNIVDESRRRRQLENLEVTLKQCKTLLQGFIKRIEEEGFPEKIDFINEKKRLLIKEFNAYGARAKSYASNIENNKKANLFDEPMDGCNEENVLLASSMTNQQLMDHGNQLMDETDQAIKRGKKVVQETINVGTETASNLKAQTEQMGRIVNELDSIHFSIKKASQLVKEIGRQVATDRCIMALLFLVVVGVVAILIVKLVNPNNKGVSDVPGLAPPAQTRRLLGHVDYLFLI